MSTVPAANSQAMLFTSQSLKEVIREACAGRTKESEITNIEKQEGHNKTEEEGSVNSKRVPINDARGNPNQQVRIF